MSLGGVARTEVNDDNGLAIAGTATPAVKAAEDLIKVLLLMVMM
jgi:hypothetical protein